MDENKTYVGRISPLVAIAFEGLKIKKVDDSSRIRRETTFPSLFDF